MGGKELTEPSSVPIELIISSCSEQGTGEGGIKKEEKKTDEIVKIEEQSFCNGAGEREQGTEERADQNKKDRTGQKEEHGCVIDSERVLVTECQ